MLRSLAFQHGTYASRRLTRVYKILAFQPCVTATTKTLVSRGGGASSVANSPLTGRKRGAAAPAAVDCLACHEVAVNVFILWSHTPCCCVC